jgi:hypothetical protein
LIGKLVYEAGFESVCCLDGPEIVQLDGKGQLTQPRQSGLGETPVPKVKLEVIDSLRQINLLQLPPTLQHDTTGRRQGGVCIELPQRPVESGPTSLTLDGSACPPALALIDNTVDGLELPRPTSRSSSIFA